MISHDRAQELISARMDAPLTPAEHRELQGHLASCTSCRAFVTQADEIARGMHAMPRLAPSPAVSRAVMSAVYAEQSGWAWLRNGLQALSSPGMAVASTMALVFALTAAILVAIFGQGGGRFPVTGQGTSPEVTVSAVAQAPLPTEIPPTATVAPTQKPAELAVAPTQPPQPTSTPPPARTIDRSSAKTPAPTQAPPTPTVAPVQNDAVPVNQPANESPSIVPVDNVPVDATTDDGAMLAMADQAPVEETAPVDLAQEAADQAPVEQAQIEQPEVEQVDVAAAPEEQAPAETADTSAEAVDTADSGEADRKGGKKDGGEQAPAEAEVYPTRQVGPVPIEAIAALEGAGGNVPDISLPPAPQNPMLPDQSFLPITPTPVTDGTPTPEESNPDEASSPQLAEDTTDDDGLAAAYMPDLPLTEDGSDDWTIETDERDKSGKKDKDRKNGDSYENQQTAYVEEPMTWSGDEVSGQVIVPAVSQEQDAALYEAPAEVTQTVEEPSVTIAQETEYPVEDPALVDDSAVAPEMTSDGSQTAAAEGEGEQVERQIDPATGMEIDPATGYLIDPTTGYLLDRVNGRIIDPRTSLEVHPMTGLLIDPATGALLDPNTLAVVVPPGFGDDSPEYIPGSDEMRGQIETVVDDNYNNASIRMEPPTDGPVQPVGEIVVPTTSGDAVEIS